MKTPITTLLVSLCTLVVGLLAAVTWSPALASDGAAVHEPPARTERPVIVAVEGDKANGFGITYSDGTALYPPTDSEASAECGEYDRWSDRLRCRVEVRTWYRDLGELKRSLAYAHAQP